MKIHQPSVISILIGTNDAKINTTAEDFKIALETLLTKAKLLVKTNAIILIEIPLLGKGVMYPFTFAMNTKTKAYNSILRELSKKHNTKICSLKLQDDDYSDGVHLNQKGLKTASKSVSDFILAERGF